MSIVALGNDLSKNSCSLVGFDGSGGVVMRRRLRRVLVEDFVGGLPDGKSPPLPHPPPAPSISQ